MEKTGCLDQYSPGIQRQDIIETQTGRIALQAAHQAGGAIHSGRQSIDLQDLAGKALKQVG